MSFLDNEPQFSVTVDKGRIWINRWRQPAPLAPDVAERLSGVLLEAATYAREDPEGKRRFEV